MQNAIKFYIDLLTKNFIKGWAFHEIHGVLPIRLKRDHDVLEVITEQRPDVCSYFNKNDIINSGFLIHVEQGIGSFELQMFDTEWKTFFNKKHVKINKNIPSFLVVDNFYEDPDEIRRFALTQEFRYHEKYHKGKRTDKVFLFDGLKESFEHYLGASIKDWAELPVNGCFQTCIGGDQLVYHNDTQDYAAVLFLTPDAPPDSGTSFFRSKYTKEHVITNESKVDVIYPNGFLDPSTFELVDKVGNVYNRLVIFNAKMIHAATSYFGTNIDNGRLFQIFFFNLK
jgi:hypothetical protein